MPVLNDIFHISACTVYIGLASVVGQRGEVVYNRTKIACWERPIYEFLVAPGSHMEPSRCMTAHTVRLEEVIVEHYSDCRAVGLEHRAGLRSHGHTGCSGLFASRRRQCLLLSREIKQTVRIQFM